MVDRVKVQGTEYKIPESFTLGELALLEEITGEPAMNGGVSLASAKGTLALVTIAIGRVDPSYTVENAKRLEPDEVDFLEEKKEAPPTKASPRRKTKASR